MQYTASLILKLEHLLELIKIPVITYFNRHGKFKKFLG